MSDASLDDRGRQSHPGDNILQAPRRARAVSPSGSPARASLVHRRGRGGEGWRSDVDEPHRTARRRSPPPRTRTLALPPTQRSTRSRSCVSEDPLAAATCSATPRQRRWLSTRAAGSRDDRWPVLPCPTLVQTPTESGLCALSRRRSPRGRGHARQTCRAFDRGALKSRALPSLACQLSSQGSPNRCRRLAASASSSRTTRARCWLLQRHALHRDDVAMIEMWRCPTRRSVESTGGPPRSPALSLTAAAATRATSNAQPALPRPMSRRWNCRRSRTARRGWSRTGVATERVTTSRDAEVYGSQLHLGDCRQAVERGFDIATGTVLKAACARESPVHTALRHPRARGNDAAMLECRRAYACSRAIPELDVCGRGHARFRRRGARARRHSGESKVESMTEEVIFDMLHECLDGRRGSRARSSPFSRRTRSA